MLTIQFGAAKVNKYASRESGDTLEIVERPVGLGGLTAVLVDGQGSGRSAKNLSNFVAGHCVALLKGGVRDGVVARAANDLLYNHKNGQVSATLNLLTVDFVSRTLVLTRNNPQPAYVYLPPSPPDPTTDFQLELDLPAAHEPTAPDLPNDPASHLRRLTEPSVPLGIYPHTRPLVRQFELVAGLVAVVFTDGLIGAGERYNDGHRLDLAAFLTARLPGPTPFTAQNLADELLELALTADRRRPQDDMSVVVLTTTALDAEEGPPLPRRMSLETSFA